MGRLSVGEIVDLVGGDFSGDPSLMIDRVRTLADAGPSDLSFLGNPKYARQVEASEAGVILVSRRHPEAAERFIRVDDPYVAIATILTRWFEPGVHPKSISELAFVAPTARIGSGVGIGPFAVVGEEVVLGDGAIIHDGASIGAGSEVGDESIIYPRATLYPGTKIGKRCVIHAGAVLGSDGFGFATTEGRHLKIPQIGIVRLEDDVEIGACTTIDRAALSETVIGSGTKIDNLVQVAHNVTVGEHSLLASQSGVSGSTVIGDHCILAGQAGTFGHITLGDQVVITARGVATKDWEGPVQLAGFPGRPLKEKLRTDAAVVRLPKTAEKIRRLEERVAQLEKLLGQHSSDEESET